MTTEAPAGPVPMPPAPPSQTGWIARVRAWFAASVAAVKAAIAPATHIEAPAAGGARAWLVAVGLISRLLGKVRGWISSARAALSSVWASVPAAWAGLTDRVGRSPWLIGLPVGLLVLVIGLVSIINDPFKTRATQPATPAVAAQPATELLDRVAALEADVVDLRGRIADLKSAQPLQAAAPSRSVATSPAGRSARAPAAAPTQPDHQQPATWGTTDLDREITQFSTTLQEPTK